MRNEFQEDAWYSRGYLAHYDMANKYQMLSYRLADSLPQSLLPPSGSAGGSPAPSPETKAEYRQKIENLLDKGYGSCLLRDPINAQIVIDNWGNFDKIRYDLISYVVMPNHVHLLIKTYEDNPLNKIVHSWKSYTAHKILEPYESDPLQAGEPPALPDKKLWQREYWDRFIRDEKHFQKAIEYIHNNPVKAGLVTRPEQWEFSSAS